MTERLRVAVIGAGRPRGEAGATGFGMAHAHVRGYLATGCCDLVAVADVVLANAVDFAGRYAGEARAYADYDEMLGEERPDIVSICTWPNLHAPMVLDAVGAGARAVHCEKPMAPTWGEAKQMHRAACSKGVQLTFNHQRRFLEPFRLARDLIREGRIGQLERLEAWCPNLLDWGTHWFDMFGFLNAETPAEWVLGQVDAREPVSIFGVAHENQGLSRLRFANGVTGLLVTGADNDLGCLIRACGSEGVLEIHEAAPHLRLWSRGRPDWDPISTSEGVHGEAAVLRGVADLVRCLEAGDEPEMSSHKALRATELAFATYESSRRRGRVDLPLTEDDSALTTMLGDGRLGGAPVEK
jgi:UDP-N-acetylglucosamine 3-dehydrogenase